MSDLSYPPVDASINSSTDGTPFEPQGRIFLIWIAGHASSTDTLTLELSHNGGNDWTATDVTATVGTGAQWIYADAIAKVAPIKGRGKVMRFTSSGSVTLEIKCLSAN
ncbi:MAG: hypothetical protein AAFU78_21115 [Cyanobacteria bacterium J06633_2]